MDNRNFSKFIFTKNMHKNNRLETLLQTLMFPLLEKPIRFEDANFLLGCKEMILITDSKMYLKIMLLGRNLVRSLSVQIPYSLSTLSITSFSVRLTFSFEDRIEVAWISAVSSRRLATKTCMFKIVFYLLHEVTHALDGIAVRWFRRLSREFDGLEETPAWNSC